MAQTLEDIKRCIAPELERINELIRSALTTSNPIMDSVISNYLRIKGKQIRPIIVMLCAKLFGSISERVISAGAAVEMLHNATLIHDDVVDNSQMRRSIPTINSVWDNHIAVLTGDFFVSTAMQQAINTGDMRVIEALCDLGKLLSVGELDQIYNARYHHLSEDAYFHIINFKTASLFVACARMGCYTVNADDCSTEAVARFAELLGLCFQIRDDIFDYFDAEKVGKPTGNDLREGKITLPLLHVLLDENAPDHDAMLALSSKEQLSDDDILVLQAYARDNGGIDYAFAKMQELRRKAADELAAVPDCEAKSQLISLFDYIIARDY